MLLTANTKTTKEARPRLPKVSDEQFEEQRVRGNNILSEVLKEFGLLDTWDVISVFYIDDFPYGVTGNCMINGVAIIAVEPSWPFLQATLHFNVPAILNMPDQALRKHITHECIHIVVNEMRERDSGALLHEERVVCTLANIITNIRNNSELAVRD
jgi:hypothetical protein